MLLHQRAKLGILAGAGWPDAVASASPLGFVKTELSRGIAVSQSVAQAPAWSAPHERRLIPRGIALRVYVAATPQGYRVMPGGLTRVASAINTRFISMQRGGSSKDTWVLSDEPVSSFSLLKPQIGKADLIRSGSNLSSRVVENLFWFGRYAERCEDLARLLRVGGRTVLSGIRKSPVDGPVAVGALGLAGDEQADLLDLRRSGWLGAGRAAAPGGDEALQRQPHHRPLARRGLEAGLVGDAVEAAVGAQVELVTPPVAAHLEQAGERADGSLRDLGQGAHRGEAAVVLQRHFTRKHPVAGRVVAHVACRHAAHHAVVDGLPGDDGGRSVEAVEGVFHGGVGLTWGVGCL